MSAQRSPRPLTRRHIYGSGTLLAVLAAALLAMLFDAARPDGSIPTTRVRRGMLTILVYCVGELRPAEVSLITAPAAEGPLRIVSLKPTGSRVAVGDTVVRFDASEQTLKLDEAQSSLAALEQQIKKARLDLAAQSSQDRVILLDAHFAVRRAELDASRNELLGDIDAEKNRLNLAEARRRLAQTEAETPSRRVSRQAGLAILEEQRAQAQRLVRQIESQLEAMEDRALESGTLALRENEMGGDGLAGGMRPPEYREGDSVTPGSIIAEILRPGQMQVRAKIDETVRADVERGQAVEIRPDALAGAVLRGRVEGVSGLVQPGSFSSVGGSKKFDLVVRVEMADARLRPGMTARLTVRGPELRDELLLPRQVVFEREGKSFVYARAGNGFEAVEITVKRRGDSLVAVDGLTEGRDVALFNPEKRVRKPRRGESATGGLFAPAERP